MPVGVGPHECGGCGEVHYYTPADVARYIHALKDIAEMASRSDAHPEVQIEKLARRALAEDVCTATLGTVDASFTREGVKRNGPDR